MQLTNTILALTAVLTSVSAHPSHRHQHQQKRSPDFFKAERPTVTKTVTVDTNVKALTVEAAITSTSTVSTTSTLTRPTPSVEISTSKPTTSSEPTAEPSVEPSVEPSSTSSEAPAETSTSSSSGSIKPFCSGNNKRATHAQNMYRGNTGSCGWGSNIMEIDPADTPLYDYTLTLSAPTDDITCHCFNKIGPDGGLNGSFQKDALTISLAKGSVKAIACEADTQAICACGFGSDVPVCGTIGQWTGTWAEFDMGSSPNGGQSGADVSVLAAQDCAEFKSFPGMRIAANGNTCSWIKKDGVEEFQAYINGNHDADGVGCTGYTVNNLDIVLGDNFSI